MFQALKKFFGFSPKIHKYTPMVLTADEPIQVVGGVSILGQNRLVVPLTDNLTPELRSEMITRLENKKTEAKKRKDRDSDSTVLETGLAFSPETYVDSTPSDPTPSAPVETSPSHGGSFGGGGASASWDSTQSYSTPSYSPSPSSYESSSYDSGSSSSDSGGGGGGGGD